MIKFAIILAIAVIGNHSAEAGEWMFRLKDAHIHLRQAMFDRDADAAWEHVDRQTRQDAAMLAARIRNAYDDLSNAKQQQLQKRLGLDERAIRSLEGKHLLVSPWFVDAHPELLVGERDDTKLKDHGTRMAGPTGIAVHKKTPQETVVIYTFTVEGHFGGQAMDYRAQLAFPSLDDLLGTAPPREELSQEEFAKQAVAVFHAAQKALAAGDVETLWPLLDCDSQSQASHFADQAIEHSAKRGEIAKLLGITDTELAKLDGKQVWTLPWTQEELASFITGTNAKYLPAESYDVNLIPQPEGSRRRGKPSPEPVVQFESDGQLWQIPVRVNYRTGKPKVTLLVRPPYYLRLRYWRN